MNYLLVPSLFQVHDLKSYTDWLNKTFIENYFSQSYYGASRDAQTVSETKPYLQDLLNFRVGPARLRQVRIRSRKLMQVFFTYLS